jgi:uncharacterized protein
MTPYLPRLAHPTVGKMLEVFPVVVVTGARQAGKSTLVRRPELFGDRTYVSLDDVLLRDQARRSPGLLLDRAPRMIIDEVQRAPDLLLEIKRRVDEERERGRYVLTGSANLLLHDRISETLAGRAGYLTLWPLTRREQLGFGSAGAWPELFGTDPRQWPDLLAEQVAPAESWRSLALRGGYPEPSVHFEDAESRSLWFDAYAATYLERDVRQLSAIENLADMRRLITALTLRLGGLLNQADIARDVGLAPTTVQRHLNLLEISCQLVRLPAFAVNRTKRLMKSQKIYWSDTGLALHLSGSATPGGAHLENLVLTDLLAWSATVTPRPQLMHWRTTKGAEVDFVVEHAGRVLPVEVKSAARVSMSDARHLRTFLDEYPDLATGALLLHGGDDVFWLDEGVLAAPWHRVI